MQPLVSTIQNVNSRLPTCASEAENPGGFVSGRAAHVLARPREVALLQTGGPVRAVHLPDHERSAVFHRLKHRIMNFLAYADAIVSVCVSVY